MSDKTHKRFGGSSASRWMNCVGSTCLIGDRSTPLNGAMNDGNAKHELGEHCLKNGDRDAFGYIGDKASNGKILNEDMIASVQIYIDAVWNEHDAAKDSELYVEHPVELADDVGTIIDAMVYTPSKKRLAVFDYKGGAQPVHADNNAQLKFGAVCAAMSKKWPLREIEVFIVQPDSLDIKHVDAVRRWSTDGVEIVDFHSEIVDKVAANKAITDLAVARQNVKAGKWCDYCLAATDCPAREQMFLAAANLNFASIVDIAKEDLPPVITLDTERLSRTLAAADLLNDWIGQVQKEVERLLLDENLSVPGWKVVEKIARAKWVEADEKIAAYLALAHDLSEDELRPRKLVTITEAERQIKAAVTDKDKRAKAIDDMRVKFTQKESSGLTIAPASDRREAVVRSAVDFKVDDQLMA